MRRPEPKRASYFNYSPHSSAIMRKRWRGTMNKSRNGTYILGGLVALQVCSMPGLVHSHQMLRFATHGLLGYIAFAVVLLWFAARNTRPLGSRPRFWTLANFATLILLGVATWAAWKANYCRFEVTVASALLFGALVHLYRRNARKRRLRPKIPSARMSVVRSCSLAPSLDLIVKERVAQPACVGCVKCGKGIPNQRLGLEQSAQKV